MNADTRKSVQPADTLTEPQAVMIYSRALPDSEPATENERAAVHEAVRDCLTAHDIDGAVDALRYRNWGLPCSSALALHNQATAWGIRPGWYI